MKKIGLGFLALIIILILSLFAYKSYLKQSMPIYEGQLNLKGLNQDVEVLFDAKGIPQIYAKNNLDLYRTLGFLHAQERLFQMELVRRLTQGNLSELFGSLALNMDKQQRQIGFAYKALNEMDSLNTEAAQILEVYCAGINSYIKNQEVLAPEFKILGFKPRDWTAHDIVTIVMYQTWFAHALMDRDPIYQDLMKQLGTDVQNYLGNFESWSPRTVPPDFFSSLFSTKNSPMQVTYASNSWVVAPEKSESGHAIHASDPHLPVNQVPNFWYIAGLHSAEGINYVGITFPSMPVAIMGHNDSIAFAFTVASIDIVDYYSIKKNKNDSLSVTIFGKNEILQQRKEIHLVESEEISQTILMSSLGPIISQNDTAYIAMKWAGYDFNYGDVCNKMIHLISANNFKEFRQIVYAVGALDVNWTYSDAHGNIAYQLGAPIPRRPKINNTYALLDATNINNQWSGYYSLDSIPYAYNPKQGYLATCNNQLVDSTFPIKIPGFYDPYRIVRITHLLNSKPTFNIQDMYNFQMDRHSVLAERHLPLLISSLKKLSKQAELLKIAETWNAEAVMDKKLQTALILWWHYLPKYIFEDELGNKWENGAEVLEDILENKNNVFIDNNKTEYKESLDDISKQTLEFVLSFDLENAANSLEISHPLAQIKILDWFLNLNREIAYIPSDFTALNVSYYNVDNSTHKISTGVAPSQRFVLDWANPDAFTLNTNLGQSGNPFSPHYDDFLEMWEKGERWNVPISRQVIEKKLHTTLLFKAMLIDEKE